MTNKNLQHKFSKITEPIQKQISSYLNKKFKIFATSSFQTQSLPLLHILSSFDSIPILFIDTGFHFKQTLEYKEEITKLFGLNVINLHPATEEKQNKLYKTDIDKCCYVHKIQPLARILKHYNVWINGVRKDQTDVRKKLEPIQKNSINLLRYHPLLNWTHEMVNDYIKHFDFPTHPLGNDGYTSIGCKPCTSKVDGDLGTCAYRSGRWGKSDKIECGLHTLLQKCE